MGRLNLASGAVLWYTYMHDLTVLCIECSVTRRLFHGADRRQCLKSVPAWNDMVADLSDLIPAERDCIG